MAYHQALLGFWNLLDGGGLPNHATRWETCRDQCMVPMATWIDVGSCWKNPELHLLSSSRLLVYIYLTHNLINMHFLIVFNTIYMLSSCLTDQQQWLKKAASWDIQKLARWCKLGILQFFRHPFLNSTWGIPRPDLSLSETGVPTYAIDVSFFNMGSIIQSYFDQNVVFRCGPRRFRGQI
jgi:hypothetical protein